MPGMDMNDAAALIFFVLACFSAALPGAYFRPGEWYEGLAKPSWRPPNWVFGPAWAILFTTIAVSAWMIWRKSGEADVTLAFVIFGVQLLLNAAWSWFYFGLRRIDLVAIDDRILDSAGILEPRVLRTLDAIHLATALALGDDLDAVVTYDERMAEAAKLVGLATAMPRAFASPLAKTIAAQESLPLEGVRGTGPGGRIMSRDVEPLRRREEPKEPLFVPPPGAHLTTLSSMRQVIGKRLQYSQATIPHFYVSSLVDVSDLVSYRERLKAEVQFLLLA